jgi:flagellar hook-basal body complex protein FliE
MGPIGFPLPALSSVLGPDAGAAPRPATDFLSQAIPGAVDAAAQLAGKATGGGAPGVDATGSTAAGALSAMPGAGSVSPSGGSLPGGPVGPAFGEVINSFVRQVDQTQHQADAMVESLALGEPVDLHQVMLSLNEASNALQLTLQVRNKVLDAYQEVMRLQV